MKPFYLREHGRNGSEAERCPTSYTWASIDPQAKAVRPRLSFRQLSRSVSPLHAMRWSIAGGHFIS